MNCLIYLLVSTKEQVEKGLNEEGLSLPAQREACLKYIQEKGWNFVDEYVDRGESARTAHRPQLQEMLSRIKKDKTINAVVVHKIDRLARNLEDHVAIKAILKRHEVALVSVVENIEDTASGRLIEGIHALMAEFYSANLGMETKKGMIQKVKQGGWPEMAPLGYTNKQQVINGRVITTIEVDDEKAPLISQAFKLYGTGNFSVEELRAILTEKGLITRATRKWSSRPVSKSNLCYLLQNKFYIGLIEWDGIEVRGIHKPLVDKETFERVQELLRIRSLAVERNRKHHHYLKGTLYCGDCGSRLSVEVKKGHVYFYCLGQKRLKKCQQRYIKAGAVEEGVLRLYESIRLPEELVAELKLRFEKEIIQRNETAIYQQARLSRRLNALIEERKKLMQAFYADAIPLDFLKSEQDRIGQEIVVIQRDLEVTTTSNELIRKTFELTIRMCQSCHLAYAKAKPDQRRMLNHAFFKRIYIKDREISGHDLTDLFGLLLKKPISSNSGSLAPRAGLEPATPRLQ